MFLVFAKLTTRQTYQMYVGKTFDPKTRVFLTQVELPGSYIFHDRAAADWPLGEEARQFDPAGGIPTVTLDMSKIPNFKTNYDSERANKCRPISFCSWSGTSCECSASPFPEFLKTECTADESRICSWAVKEVDCPLGGCYGFGVRLADDFKTFDTPLPPPKANTFISTMSDWAVPFKNISDKTDACYYGDLTPKPVF